LSEEGTAGQRKTWTCSDCGGVPRFLERRQWGLYATTQSQDAFAWTAAQKTVSKTMKQ
jgi:hypothetical protein